jgi:DNA-binding transcriptional regulator GbsR (MarR family)
MPKIDPKIERVVAALEDARYEWRTVKGVVDQTGLSREEVLEALIKLIDEEVVIRSTVPSERGEDLYTTREHYKRFTSLSKRLGAAFRNRAD